MKIVELDLRAYGPFTERRLCFPENGPGLQVVYGANEAGKSSALRAIRDLLYGIPSQSTDDFLHPYKQMRVGARLRFGDGRDYAFLRRKANKNSVFAPDDRKPIDDQPLQDLVRQVPEALFRNFYGIDHVGLAEGSRALLEDDGELGRSLFAAGLGGGNLRALLESLEAEADSLFSPRGKIKTLNAALGELRGLQSEIKESALKPAEWDALNKAAAQASERVDGLEGELAAAQKDRERLERVQRTLEPLARRRRLHKSLEEMGEVPDLALDFAERLTQCRVDRAQADLAREDAARSLGALAERLEAVIRIPWVLEEAERIEALPERLGSSRKAREDLPRREAELERIDREIAASLSAMGFEVSEQTVRALEAPLARTRQIRELVEGLGSIEEAAAAANAAIEGEERAVTRWEDEIAAETPIPELAALRRAIARSQKLGDVDLRVADRRRAATDAAEACVRGCEALGRWSGKPDDLERVAFPDLASLERLASEAAHIAEQQERCRERIERAETEQRETEEQLAALHGEGAVPSEADLEAVRSERDATWRRIRAGDLAGDRAEGGAPEVGAGSESLRGLEDAFEESIRRSDGVADRLRFDADRVARNAALSARRTTLLGDIERARAEAEEWQNEEARFDRAWSALWAGTGVELGPPSDMIPWRRRLDQLLDSVAAARVLRAEWQAEDADRGEARDRILNEMNALGLDLVAAGEELADVLAEAQLRLGRFDESLVRRARRREEKGAAEARLAEAQAAGRRNSATLDGWRSEWVGASEGLGLAADARPGLALDRLAEIERVLEKIREREKTADRIAGMQREIDDFGEALSRFLEERAPELAGADAEGAVGRLRLLLREASEAEIRHREVIDLLEEAREQGATADARWARAQQGLDRLVEEASVPGEEELDGVVQSWQAYRADQAALADVHRQLESELRSLDEMEADASSIDPDALVGAIREAGLRVEELEIETRQARDERTRLRHDLERLDGSDEVARLAESEQEKIASIRASAERYVTYRLAQHVLDDEIERYKRENQAPVLERAGGLFRGLTLGAYGELRSDFGEAGAQHLIAIRSHDGREVSVEGMSAGTRDQLFLALRLATLEESLERSESMPLIADDILVHFDDARSESTLDVLAGLGERMQILLFTHHGRVREMAEALGDRAGVIDLTLA